MVCLFLLIFKFIFDSIRLSIPKNEGGIRGVKIPLIADKTMEITKKFGILNEDEGTPYRFVSI